MMRNFIAGLICGAFLLILTAAGAPSAIQAKLFPSKITIHNGSHVVQIDGTGPDGIINYKNKAYIPIRLFSEAMGAQVNYEAASSKNGNLHQIEVFNQLFLDQLRWSDSNGYVTIGNLSGLGNNIKEGRIKINKDIVGKAITIYPLSREGEYIGSSTFVYIDNAGPQDTPKVGDIRTFKTSLPQSPINMYQVYVEDKIQRFTFGEQTIDFVAEPIFSRLFPDNDSGPFSKGQIIVYDFTFSNTSGNLVTLDKLPLHFVVYEDKGNEINESSLVFKEKITEIQGDFKKLEGLKTVLMWDQRNSKGVQVPAGKYLAGIEIPDEISLYNHATKKQETIPFKLQYGAIFSLEIK